MADPRTPNIAPDAGHHNTPLDRLNAKASGPDPSTAVDGRRASVDNITSFSDDKVTTRPWASPRVVLLTETLLLVALFIGAVTVRMPMLIEAPALTDETIEVLFALEVYRGEILPLTNADAYYGPFWAFLLAGAFHLFGPSPVLPRAVVLATGAATVVMVYLLGRESAGRAAGIVAAALLLTAPWHILTHSHVAWSHSLSPLITTTAVLLEIAALKRGNGKLLVGSGFVLGLALQSHLTILALIPGMALGLLAHPRGRQWLRTPWPYLAAVAAVIAYSPMIVYNIQHPLATLTEGRQRVYAVADVESARYLATLTYFPLRMLHDLVGIAVGPVQEVYQVGWPSDVAAAPLALLAIGSVLHGIWSRRLVLVLALVSIVLLLPIFTFEYNGGRYMAPAWPILHALIGGFLVALAAELSQLPTRGFTIALLARRTQWMFASAIVGLSVVFLTLRTLPYLNDYYADAVSRGETSGPLIGLVERAAAARSPGQPVLLDERLVTYGATYAGASSLLVSEYVLSTSRVPHGLLVSNPVTAEWLTTSSQPHVAILTSATRDELTQSYGLYLERVSEDLAVRVPTGAIVRNIPSPLIPTEPAEARPLAIYRILPDETRPVRSVPERELSLFDGQPARGWDFVGWRSTMAPRPDVPAPDGDASIAVRFVGPHGGQLLHGPNMSTQGYDRLEFDVHGGTASNHPLLVSLRDSDNQNLRQVPINGYSEWGGIHSGIWRRVSIPLSALNAVDQPIRGVEILMNRKYPAPTIYIANLRLVARNGDTSVAQAGGVRNMVGELAW